MRKYAINILILILIVIISKINFAQIPDIVCTEPQINKSAIEAQTGGLYKPSSTAPGQYFRILFVFAEFTGDTNNYDNWNYGQLPNYANNIVDSVVSSSYRPFTLSDYWKTMSFGNFEVIGEIYPNIITLRPENWYKVNGKSFQDANKDVLDSINGKIDFKRYDNWGLNLSTQSFYFSPRNADGYLDMMYIIYRNPSVKKDSLGNYWFGNFDGIAMLGSNFTFQTYDSVYIDARGMSHLGSGITIRRGAGMNYPDFLTRLLCHEYGHYLFGSGHIRYSGIMSARSESHSHFLCSWERERLGYIAFTTAYQDGFTISLEDYITTGQVLKVPIPGYSDKFYLVENHQRLNRYDQITRGGTLQGAFDTSTTLGKGIYIWLVQGGNYYAPTITSISATGRWNWVYDGEYNAGPGWGNNGKLPKTKKGSINRDNGIDDRYPIHTYYNGDWYAKWVDINPLTKEYEITRNCMGIPEQAFNLATNNIFSPWSNPSSKFNNNDTNISIQIYSQNGNFITIKVFYNYNSGINLPPSKPQFLRTSVSNNFVTLNWEPNIEPDMYPYGKYKIYRGYTSNNTPPSNYGLVATLNAYNGNSPVDNWTDPDIFGGTGNDKLFYRIVAVDNSNLNSVPSDWDWVYWDKTVQKDNAVNEVKEFKLHQNYPNPFNPVTTIRYDLKKNSYVELKIYDLLGNELVTLVNNYEDAGSHTAIFDASRFPSGIYLYRLTTSDFTNVKKLIILK
jgi:hypothetical protein